MSTRYGVELIIGPGLSALIDLARQATCAQFGCAGADRLPLRMSLVPFFEVPDRELDRVAGNINECIVGMPDGSMSFWMSRSHMWCDESTGNVMMEMRLHGNDLFSIFGDSKPRPKKRSLFGFGRRGQDAPVAEQPEHPLYTLQRKLWESVAYTHGVRMPARNFQFKSRVTILEYSGLKGSDLVDAAKYTASALASFEAAVNTSPWLVWLVRYHSELAGDDWSSGRWMEDVTWQRVRSFHLSTDQTV